MRAPETPNLSRWREASKQCSAVSRSTAELFTEYLASGGPDAIKGLQATVRKLQAQLEEQKADGRLERYRKLQKDLEECDKVRASLREALLSCQWSEDEVDAYLQRRLFKASSLYGASRELLLKENRLLRAQLEEHHVTSRTSRAAGAAGQPGPDGRSPVPESKLRQARMMQGPHMEAAARLLDAAHALDQAEAAYRLPAVRHAEVQADDGFRKLVQTLQEQVGALAGQKAALLHRVADMTEAARVLDMKLEGALDQVAELRRQKTDMLAHQDNLSKDLREHLLSEARRADAAEALQAEARLAEAAARGAEAEARQQAERALAEAQASQAALAEKTAQVDTLRGLYLELREALEALAGDVAAGQQEAARRLLEANREQLLDQRALLQDVQTTSSAAHRATQHHTEVVTQLASQQAALAAGVAATQASSGQSLLAFERQLGATQALLAQSEADRVRLARQAIAASVLNRMEDKRHEQAVRALAAEVPDKVAGRLAPQLAALAEGTEAVAEEVERTQQTLAEAGVLVGGGGKGAPGGGLLHAPLVPDAVDDATTQLLAGSALLRSQLHALHAGAPGQLPGPQRDVRGGVDGLFRAAPPGVPPPQLAEDLQTGELGPAGAAPASSALVGVSEAGVGELRAAPMTWHPPGVVPSVESPPAYLTGAPHGAGPRTVALERADWVWPAGQPHGAALTDTHGPVLSPVPAKRGAPPMGQQATRLDLVLQLQPGTLDAGGTPHRGLQDTALRTAAPPGSRAQAVGPGGMVWLGPGPSPTANPAGAPPAPPAPPPQQQQPARLDLVLQLQDLQPRPPAPAPRLPREAIAQSASQTAERAAAEAVAARLLSAGNGRPSRAWASDSPPEKAGQSIAGASPPVGAHAQSRPATAGQANAVPPAAGQEGTGSGAEATAAAKVAQPAPSSAEGEDVNKSRPARDQADRGATQPHPLKAPATGPTRPAPTAATTPLPQAAPSVSPPIQSAPQAAADAGSLTAGAKTQPGEAADRGGSPPPDADGAGGLSAHVWRPSSALLQAFRDIPL